LVGDIVVWVGLNLWWDKRKREKWVGRVREWKVLKGWEIKFGIAN
jgi:hypothetical protein